MSRTGYFLAFVFMGAILSLVVRSLREDEIAKVWKPALWSFAKLAIGSFVAILMVEALYEYTLFTYPVLAVLFAWLILGDRLWDLLLKPLRRRGGAEAAAGSGAPAAGS